MYRRIILLVAAGIASSLQAHADIDEELLKAAEKGQAAKVRALLAAGEDVNAVNEESGGYSALMLAAKNGHAEIVKILIDAGADINRSTYPGTTSLMFAAREGHIEIVEIFLDVGADQDQLGYNGVSALQYAEDAGHTAIVKLLSAKKVNKLEASSSLPDW